MNSEHTMWMEIVQRLEAGAMQSEVARAYGMSRGKFRYRLARFLEASGIELVVANTTQDATSAARAELALAMSEVAATVEGANTTTIAPTASDKPEPSPAKSLSQRNLDIPLVDLSLRDASLVEESWNRAHGLNRLVAMVKEPRTLFTYWEINESRKHLIQAHFRADWSQLPFCLVVHDITDLHFNGTNAHNTIRIEVNPRAESWYIHGVTPGRRYQIDFCTQTIAGQLFTILRSNIVETPPLPPAHHQEPLLKFGTIHQETPEYLRAKDAQLAPASLQAEPWHDQFTGYNLAEGKTSGEGDQN
ncbi:DUF4912 domain-containing protein [Tumebacillus permanentifrigoris]|uniref:DUF4912 domain-containing protein n=1 Tax=Tumebacillus permanentifrigoris TaxID=378543 RepID=UPI001474A912|nr:DUF4912 domain-containing protein [Tumebacillus permanentifrigoris]